ncbi:MAG: YbaN family protein [Bryobacter sp.]|jgi:hypothetical protein|nr:YbaN family protein [Bryobacter sp.]
MTAPSSLAAKRALFGGLGWCAVALGLAGVFVPGLPSTVFVILAAYLFSKCSPRWEAWLLSHRWLGPSLRRFREQGGMPRPAKVAALASMWSAVSVSCLMLGAASLTLALATVALGGVGTAVILFAVRTV